MECNLRNFLLVRCSRGHVDEINKKGDDIKMPYGVRPYKYKKKMSGDGNWVFQFLLYLENFKRSTELS